MTMYNNIIYIIRDKFIESGFNASAIGNSIYVSKSGRHSGYIWVFASCIRYRFSCLYLPDDNFISMDELDVKELIEIFNRGPLSN